jgi:prepilin-type N-terminal cleavage/methylation domain-containing protein/prepilin-type processing-associated H-X9-DG protein
MSKQNKKGFTLAELLVVIAIIGILATLILPAVNVATGVARKNQCLNNQRTWGQAMMAHATDKEYFPGRVSLVKPNYPHVAPLNISWMTRLLPYIDKNNEWEQMLSVKDFFIDPIPATPEREKIELEIATCPSDPPESTGGWRTSYIANVGVWDGEYTKTRVKDTRWNGVCHDLRPEAALENRVDPGFISKNDGTSTTLLLSENVNAIAWPVIEETLHGFVWMIEPWKLEPRSVSSTDQIYAINVAMDEITDSEIESLLQVPDRVGAAMLRFARPSSQHTGGVNVIYCDGHGAFLSQEIDWTVYKRLLTPSDENALHPHVTKADLQTRYPLLFAPLSDTDLNP